MVTVGNARVNKETGFFTIYIVFCRGHRVVVCVGGWLLFWMGDTGVGIQCGLVSVDDDVLQMRICDSFHVAWPIAGNVMLFMSRRTGTYVFASITSFRTAFLFWEAGSVGVVRAGPSPGILVLTDRGRGLRRLCTYGGVMDSILGGGGCASVFRVVCSCSGRFGLVFFTVQ